MKPLLKRPFAFWFPAFGFAFLLWSWVDSCYHTTTTYLGYTGSDRFVGSVMGLRSAAFHLDFSYGSGGRAIGRPRAASPYHASTTRYVLPSYSSTWWFPLPDLKSKHESGPSTSLAGRIFKHSSFSASIPHWCLVPAYLALWWAALRWHARRQSRIKQAAADAFHLTRSAPEPQTGFES